VTNIKIYLTTLFRAGEPHTTTTVGTKGTQRQNKDLAHAVPTDSGLKETVMANTVLPKPPVIIIQLGQEGGLFF
jgi:hypothetical protein